MFLRQLKHICVSGPRGGADGGVAVITRAERVRMGWMSTIRLTVIVEDTGGRPLQLN